MRFRTFPVKIGATTIPGVTEVGLEDGFSSIRELTDGQVDPSAQATSRHAPRVSWSTIAISSALAAVGFDSTIGNFEVFDAKIGQAGDFSSDSVHVKHTIASARSMPVSLSAGEGDTNARLSCLTAGFHADGTAPHTIAKDQALPSVSANAEMFGLGPVYIGSTQISGITGVDINFGIEAEPDHSDGSIVPKDIALISRLPTITLSSRYADLQTLAKGLGGQGSLGLTDPLWIYFRKRTPTGYVATATAEHLRVSVAAGEIYFGGSAGNPRVWTMRIEPKRASVASVVVTPSVAIAAPGP